MIPYETRILSFKKATSIALLLQVMEVLENVYLGKSMGASLRRTCSYITRTSNGAKWKM